VGYAHVNKKETKKQTSMTPPHPNHPVSLASACQWRWIKEKKDSQNFLVSAGVGTSTMAGTQETHQISNPHITSLTIRKLTTSPTPSGSRNFKPTKCE